MSDASAYQRVTDTAPAPFATLGYLDITLLNGQPQRCTGTAVAQRVVLTSASCLKPGRDVDGALAAQMRFVPGQTQAGPGAIPTQPFAAKTYWYYEMPTVFYDQIDANPDYAAVFFKDAVTSGSDFLGVALDVAPTAASVIGYASAAAGETNSQALWQARTTATGLAPRRLGLPIGFDAGLSGAPVIESTTAGLGRIVAVAVGGDGSSLSATRLLAADATLINRWLGLAVPPQPLSTGWWWAPAEPGRGYFIEVANGKLFLAVLGYAGDGAATWRIASGAMESAQRFRGALTGYGGGSPIAGPFHAPAATEVAGEVVIDFIGTAAAQLTTPWGLRRIERFSFVPNGVTAGSPGAPYPQNGFWWNPDRPGIGVVIEVQGSSMMVATLDYDASGRATWAFASNAMVVPLLFAAPSTIVTAGPPDTGTWRPVSAVASGQLFVLQVKATDNMVMSLAGGAVQLPLNRFRF